VVPQESEIASLPGGAASGLPAGGIATDPNRPTQIGNRVKITWLG
jgi:hypothetical protein